MEIAKAMCWPLSCGGSGGMSKYVAATVPASRAGSNGSRAVNFWEFRLRTCREDNCGSCTLVKCAWRFQ